MRTPLVSVVVMLGCGGTPSRPAPAPPAATAAPAQPVTFYDRLHDAPGPVAGLPGFALQYKQNPDYCGGTQVVTTRTEAVDLDDAPLASVFAIEFPSDLDFAADDATRREDALRRFNAFLDDMKAASAAAVKHYEQELGTQREFIAAARIAQVSTRFASVVARAPIPVDVRTGEYASEKIAAYCDALTTAAEPLVTQAQVARKACADRLRTSSTRGWWNAYCSAN